MARSKRKVGAAPEVFQSDKYDWCPPGFFALNYPIMTALGFFTLHALFGIIVGAIYGA